MSGLPINDLAKAIADATGWVQHIAELNAALVEVEDLGHDAIGRADDMMIEDEKAGEEK